MNDDIIKKKIQYNTEQIHNSLKLFDQDESITIYHYTHLDNWKDIKQGSWKSDNAPGLGTCRRIGREDEEAYKTTAAFALLDPLPEQWAKNPHFREIWSFLTDDIGELLLEIKVYPKKDKVFIIDRGHIEGFLYEKKKGIPWKYLHSSRLKAERTYMKSKISIDDYLKNKDEVKYSLPEVIFLENIPLERIKISNYQPLIIQKLESYKGILRDQLVRQIEGIPELDEWYRQNANSIKSRCLTFE